MAGTQEHLTALLGLSAQERARAAKVLLDSLCDPDDADAAADDADIVELQDAEVARRIEALDAGAVEVIEPEDARRRVQARLRAIRQP